MEKQNTEHICLPPSTHAAIRSLILAGKPGTPSLLLLPLIPESPWWKTFLSRMASLWHLCPFPLY